MAPSIDTPGWKQNASDPDPDPMPEPEPEEVAPVSVPDPDAYQRGFDAALHHMTPAPTVPEPKGTPAVEVKLPNLSALVKFVESLVAPFEKLAAYYAAGGVGVANYPHLPNSVRAVVAAAGAALIAVDRNKS